MRDKFTMQRLTRTYNLSTFYEHNFPSLTPAHDYAIQISHALDGLANLYYSFLHI